MKISFDGNRLILGSKMVEMEVRVREVEQFRDIVLVRLAYDDYTDGDPNGERNIVALDREGGIRWRIQQAPSAPTVNGKRVVTSYVGIDPNTGKKDRLVVAYDSSGLCWKVDPETGQVSDPIFTR